MQKSSDVLFKIIQPNLILSESINSANNAKIILEEIILYENFLTSMKQYLQSRYDDTIEDLSQNLVNTKDAGVLIKNIITNPNYMETVVEQLNKQTRNLMKSIRAVSTEILSKTSQNNALANVSNGLKELINNLTTKITQSLRIPGWKGFLYSLGVYSFSKFILTKFIEYRDSASSLLTFFTTGASELFDNKLNDLSDMIINISGTTMSGFMSFFADMAEIGKIFVSILAYIKRKLNFGGDLGLQNAPTVKVTEEGVGRIVKNVNTTVDVGPNEISKQAAKFGNKVTKDGYPPILNKKAVKNTSINKLSNLGLSEQYSSLELAIMEGGHAIEPHPEGYSDDLLTMPKYALVVNTPSDMDWYKIGQHYTSLGTEDPDEYGQGDSDMVIVPANESELAKLKAMLDRLNIVYKDIGSTREQPELHMEGIMIELDNMHSILDEGLKDKLKKAALVGAMGVLGMGAVGTKNAYDKLQTTNPASVSQKFSQPERPISKTPSTQGSVQKSELAPKTSIRPQAKPVQKSELAPKTSIRPRARDTLTDSRYESYFKNFAKKYGINNDELAALLAQAAHETDYFGTLVEYGDEEDFDAYEGRNGNTDAGDGYKYRGRGFLHLTGKENYEKAGKKLGLDLVGNPDLVSTPKVAALTSIWYWINRVRPDVSDFNDVAEVTYQVNGGDKGLEQRKENFEKYIELMGDSRKTEENLKESIGKRLGDLAEIKTKFEDADFWIWRRNSIEKVGSPTREYNPQHIGIKVIRKDLLMPEYLFYLMQYMHMQGYFRKLSKGATNLVNITTDDVKNISFALKESSNKKIEEAVKKLKEAEIVDLDQKREDEKLKKFHKGFMGDISDRVNDKREAYNIANEQGLFDDLPVGTRFTLPKGSSYKVLSHSMKTRKTDQLPRHELEFRHKFNMGPAKMIEYNGNYYQPIIYTEEVAGEMAGSTSGFDLDKLVNFSTGEKRYKKFTGPKKMTERNKPDQVRGSEPIPAKRKPSNTGFQKHPYMGRLVGENSTVSSIGYKIMAYDPKTKTAYSLADEKVKFPLVKNKEIKVGGKGIYLSNSENFVKTYYSGLTNNDEILIKFEYKPDDIISGNDTDSESEFTVSNARIVGYENINTNITESNEWYHGTPEVNKLRAEGGFKNRTINVSYISDPEEWNRLHKEIETLTPSDDNYFKLLDDAGKLEKYMIVKNPIFLTNILAVANTYTDERRAFDYQTAVSKVLKVSVEVGKVLTINSTGTDFRGISVNAVINGLKENGIPDDKIQKALQMFTRHIRNGKLSTDSLAVIAQLFDFDIVDVVGVLDSYNVGKTKSTVRMVFDPSKIKIISGLYENMSITGTETARIAKKKGLQPGTDEWFEHWFSLPYMIDQRNKKYKPRGMGVKPS
jgi:putative chitinase